MRLNKYIASSGLCSRRKADEHILAGNISVNGKKLSTLGYEVKDGDLVSYMGKALSIPEQCSYILLNKPKNCVTTKKDTHERTTVLDIVGHKAKSLFPVGRLDRQTQGLLLLTDDGDLAHRLSHPSFKTKKIYFVTLDRPISIEDFDAIIHREFELEDGGIDFVGISVISSDNTQLAIELHSGRNRIIRRVFEHLKYDIVKLDRVHYAGLDKKGLGVGKWRYLKKNEIEKLKKRPTKSKSD